MRVEFSSLADRKITQILDYLEAKFGERIAERAILMLQAFEKRVAQMPELYPVFDTKTNTRKAVLRKRMLVFYVIQVLCHSS